ncbi:hypothetical protein RN001_012490 [Aquatica leii]|uniref:UDP-glycosyltransferases domain-containing protein n=1 Tax=Aquatica leii TaxID=1421715 RepID=A0AAN7P5I3_9COLE|nr:hypothetical protein RN001_012490 [Aquatica leii]
MHMPMYSHYKVHHTLYKELIGRGHNVTLITPFKETTPNQNFTSILINYNADMIDEYKNKFSDSLKRNVLVKNTILEEFLLYLTEQFLNNTEVQSLLQSDEKFDVIIMQQNENEAMKGFCRHFNVPCISIIPFASSRWSNPYMSNPGPPSFVPELLSNFHSDMNFYERLCNSILYFVLNAHTHIYAYPKQNALLKKYFPNAPSLYDIMYNTSLMLINSHYSIHTAVPYNPNMIEVGGMHIATPKPLSKDLQNILDNASNGAIYFSLGTNVKLSFLPNDVQAGILSTFSKLKQTVLCKWDEELTNISSNIKMKKWFPQNDILAHSNIKLFISHGGQLSTTEAVYHGVPVLGIPIFLDQHINIANSVNSGYALSVFLEDFTPEKFENAVNELINNSKYYDNVKKRSQIYHDQTMKPLDRAVFWIEHVIRHGGAAHLKTAAANLTWYQYFLLDVIAALIITAILIIYKSANILGLMYASTYSHYKVHHTLYKELSRRGHNVTLITGFKETNPIKNIRTILLEFDEPEIDAFKKMLSDSIKQNVFAQNRVHEDLSLIHMERLFNHPEVLDLVKSNEKFDVVIMLENQNHAMKGFCHHFGAPCISVTPFAASRWSNPYMSNSGPPSFVPELFSHFHSNMNFYERFYNSLLYFVLRLHSHIYAYSKQEALFKKMFPNGTSLYDVMYNTSLMLINSHYSIHSAVPYNPNMIEVGGLHVEPPKALPKDLQLLLDNAKQGAIFFCLGTNIKPEFFPNKVKTAILNTFAKLNQTVLCKWDEKITNISSNIKMKKWFPQSDVLAHPNVKLFISHGGQLSTTEAVYHGVPVLGIPMFLDQYINIASIVNSGYALTVSLEDFTQEKFETAVNEMLKNSKYRNNVKKRSQVYHDQPMKPLERAMFWIEHVIRHGGAPHLRTAAANLTWYQYFLLDVIGLFILIVICAVLSIAILFKMLWTKCLSHQDFVKKNK